MEAIVGDDCKARCGDPGVAAFAGVGTASAFFAGLSYRAFVLDFPGGSDRLHRRRLEDQGPVRDRKSAAARVGAFETGSHLGDIAGLDRIGDIRSLMTDSVPDARFGGDRSGSLRTVGSASDSPARVSSVSSKRANAAASRTSTARSRPIRISAKPMPSAENLPGEGMNHHSAHPASVGDDDAPAGAERIASLGRNSRHRSNHRWIARTSTGYSRPDSRTAPSDPHSAAAREMREMREMRDACPPRYPPRPTRFIDGPALALIETRASPIFRAVSGSDDACSERR